MNSCFSMLVAFCFVCLTVGYVGCNVATETPSADTVDAVETGSVTVEFLLGDSDDPVTVVVDDVTSGSTVAEVMQGIESPVIEMSGSGITAFVSKIGDLATADGDGWTYRVDDEFINTGIGTTILTPPATVTWSHGSWDSKQSE